MMRDNQRLFFVDFGSMPQENSSPEQTNNLTTSADQLFNTALALQQKKDWELALNAYRELLSDSINLNDFQASVAYHNMSLIAYEMKNNLMAYAWSKKSLALNPGNQLAKQSFEHFSKNVEIPAISHNISTLDTLKVVVSKVPLDIWLSLCVVLILFTFIKVLKNITLKRRQPGSKQKKWPIWILLFFSILIISISYVSYNEGSVIKAIVISDKAAVQTAPGDQKAVIFEAPLGLELEVLKSEGDFFQVRYPGAFSGWIKAPQLEVMSLSFKHAK